MLDAEVKRRIKAARDTLVGQVPDPLGQVRHITIALMHRFMSDRDRASVEQGGKPAFFIGEFAQFAWDKILNPRIGGEERVELYHQAVEKMADNSNLPAVFREMFRGAFVSFKDPQTLFLFLQEVDNLPVRSSEDLGNAFEHILSILGTQGQAGQFRTPRHIIEFITETVAPQKGERVLDPACGSAGFLIAAHRRILRENSSAFHPEKHQFAFAGNGGNGDNAADAVYSNGQFNGDNLTPREHKKLAANIHGYDISPDMIRLSLVNMFLHQNRKPEIHAYDALTSQNKWDEDFEVILANPPFMSPRGGIRPHGRFSIQSSRSEVLFVDYILEHLTSRGRAGIIVPEGIIFQAQNAHKTLRKNLVENGLRAVVSLPNGIFNPYSGVKTSILFVDREQARNNDEILFVHVENDGYDLGAQRRRIKKNDLPAAFVLLRDWARGIKTASSPLAHLWVKRETIADDGEYNLTAERYRPSRIRAGAKWPQVQLGDITTIRMGETLIKKNLTGKGLPVFSADESNRPWGFTDNARLSFSENTIVIGARGTIGSVKFPVLHAFTCTQTTIAVSVGAKMSPAYVARILMNFDFKSITEGSGIPMVTVANMAQIPIPMPPLEFQQELVSELDSYQRVIDGARQVVENWRPQVPANPEWPLVQLGEICELRQEHIDPGKKLGRCTYVGLENIQPYAGVLVGDIADDYQNIKSQKTVFVKGNVLFGKLRPNLNKVLFAEMDGICSTDIYALSAQKGKVLAEFLAYVLRSDSVNARILAGVSGAQLPRVSWSFMRGVEIRMPPLKVQREIVSLLESERKRVESCRELMESHAEKIRVRVEEVWDA